MILYRHRGKLDSPPIHRRGIIYRNVEIYAPVAAGVAAEGP